MIRATKDLPPGRHAAPAPAVLASAVRELVAEIANRLTDELLAQGSLDWLHTARAEAKA
ncbi:hypothetical protein ACFUJX_06155 [Streptomyces rubiginosohelvolus]|uniref:hypothetical protein n=1 Tax=Streptomyces TaxID=1883 RepID=UPI00131590E0|nr:hypothetical protein [Streptomyces sp. NP10]